MIDAGYEVRDADGTVIETAGESTWSARAIVAANRVGHAVEDFQGATRAFRVWPGARFERVGPEPQDAEAEGVESAEARAVVHHSSPKRTVPAVRAAKSARMKTGR